MTALEKEVKKHECWKWVKDFGSKQSPGSSQSHFPPYVSECLEVVSLIKVPILFAAETLPNKIALLFTAQILKTFATPMKVSFNVGICPIYLFIFS